MTNLRQPEDISAYPDIFFQKISSCIETHKGPCEIYAAPFAVFLNQDDRTYVEPDISVICDPDKLDDRGCNGAPDWIIEIVSPASRRMDYSLKLFKYRLAGVREYWIVDPDKNRVTVWNFVTDDIGEYSFADTVKAGIHDELYLDFSQPDILGKDGGRQTENTAEDVR